MENEDVHQDIKNCIIEYGYPLADSMSDEEIGDIFKISNRCFLVCWLLEIVCEYNFSEDEKNINTLGQFLYDSGFCTKEDKLPFMTGTLDTLDQFKILQRIFRTIKAIKKPVSSITLEPVSLEEIENISKLDMNLFPMFGDIQTSTNENKSNIPKIEITEETSSKFTIFNTKNIEDIELDLSVVKNVAENYQNQNDKSMSIDEETLKEVHRANENIKLISQFLKDCTIIENFTKNNEDLLRNNQENTISSVDFLKDISEEIANIIRYQE